MTTAHEEVVQVLLEEEDGRDAVLLLERGSAPRAKPPRPKARRPRR